MPDSRTPEELLKRQLERERNARKQAENLIEEKSRELYQSNQELDKLNTELAASNQELENFANIASHDLQAPLRNILSFVELLERDKESQLSKDATEFFEFITKAARHMQVLINDLLQLSRITSKAEPHQAVQMQAVADQAKAMLMATLEDANAEVRYDNLPEVWGDSGQLTQLLQNLIGNGIKFQAPDVKPEVVITAQAEGDKWHFVVQDNGIGIEKKNIDAIFAIFRRLHTAEQYPGTGIGLSICKKVVERHGGRIWVESEPGGGAAFHFLLPKAPETAQENGGPKPGKPH